MTASIWLDVAIAAVAALAALAGWRQGATASSIAILGVLGGAVIGVAIVPPMVGGIDDFRLRVFIAVLTITLLVVIGQAAGMWFGRSLRAALTGARTRTADQTAGAVLQICVVLALAWLVAVPMASVQSPAAAAVRGSWVLGGVDRMAPDWARTLPARMALALDESGLPEVLGPFQRTPVAGVDPPDATLVERPGVQTALASTVEVLGSASRCARGLEGSGFVIAPSRVMTNAHVVAGTDRVVVQDGAETLPAVVTYYDPDTDVAVLAVPGLRAPVLDRASAPLVGGDDAVLIGYPGGGPLTMSPARIRDRITLSGPDIYRSGTVERDVYTLRGQVRSGNSGGPLVDPQGRLVGMIFGAATDSADTGFALTLEQLEPVLRAASGLDTTVATGGCVA